MGWSSKYICLGLPSICICVEAKALSGRSTTGLMGESQNPLAGLRGWKLYKDPFISFGGNPVTPPGGDRYDWTSQKNILKHLLQLRRYDRYGCKFKGNPCRLHTETWEGGKETWRMFIFWWWSMQMKLGLKHEHVTPTKTKNGRGEKKLQGKSLCVWNLVFLKTNPTLPWELVTAFHGSTSFSKGKFYRVDFWKNKFQAAKNPAWRIHGTHGLCLPIYLKSHKKTNGIHGSVNITLLVPWESVFGNNVGSVIFLQCGLGGITFASEISKVQGEVFGKDPFPVERRLKGRTCK